MSEPSDALGGCPGCGAVGRRVSLDTVHRFAMHGADELSPTGVLRLCVTPRCDVAYYAGEGRRWRIGEVSVALFHKSEDPERFVCYCFNHSVRDVLETTRPDGSNASIDAITAACRAGLDRCLELNPAGRCCLGDVRSLVATAPNEDAGMAPRCENCAPVDVSS